MIYLYRAKSAAAVKFVIAVTIVLACISVSAANKSDDKGSAKPSVLQNGNSDNSEDVAGLIVKFKYGDTVVCRAVAGNNKNKKFFEIRYFHMKIAPKSCEDKNLDHYVIVNHGVTGGVFIKIVRYLEQIKTSKKILRDAIRYNKEVLSFKYLSQFKSELYHSGSNLYISHIRYDFGDHDSQSYYSILLRSKKDPSHGWTLAVDFFPDGMAIIGLVRSILD